MTSSLPYFVEEGKTTQYTAIDEAIKTTQFVRNKAIRHWMDNRGVGQKELYRLSKTLREEFSSRKIHKEFEEHLKRYFWKPYFWSRSYSLFSVGGRAPLEVLLRYIQQQDAQEK